MLSRFLARVRRRRTARDLARRMAELDRLDNVYGLGAMPSAASSRRRRRARRGRSSGVVLPSAATAVILVAVIALSPNENSEAVRRALGFGSDRLGAAPEVTPGGGSFTFMQTQVGSDEPVAYNPCRTIEVAVNPRGAPDDHDELVDTGLARVAEATGLTFVRVGDTDARDVDRGIAARRPVLIRWATPKEVPGLAGDVAGLGGSVATGQPGRMRYVTGSVVLDRALFASFGWRDGRVAQAIVDHELAHLVGLGHVDDQGELMNEHGMTRTRFGPGDLEGLARIGRVAC